MSYAYRIVGGKDNDEQSLFFMLNAMLQARIDVGDETTDDEETLFRLEDDGPGIPEAIRGKLFEAFTTSGKEEGTGLGLAIVRRIIEDHGGSISFTTRTGVGTCFTIRLPRQPDDTAAPEPVGR